MSEPLIVGKIYKMKPEYEVSYYKKGEQFVCYKEAAPHYDWKLGSDGQMHLVDPRRWDLIRVSDRFCFMGESAGNFEECADPDNTIAKEVISACENRKQLRALQDEIGQLKSQYSDQTKQARSLQAQLDQQIALMTKTKMRLMEIQDMGIEDLAYMFDM